MIESEKEKNRSSEDNRNFIWLERSAKFFTVGVYWFSFMPDIFFYSKTSTLWCQMDKSIQSHLLFLDFPF